MKYGDVYLDPADSEVVMVIGLAVGRGYSYEVQSVLVLKDPEERDFPGEGQVEPRFLDDTWEKIG